MSAWNRLYKSLYRKEPISGFILTVGVVDAVMGGVGTRWTLFSFGSLLVLVAITLRLWQAQKTQTLFSDETPRRYLPPRSSNTPLPLLTHDHQHR